MSAEEEPRNSSASPDPLPNQEGQGDNTRTTSGSVADGDTTSSLARATSQGGGSVILGTSRSNRPARSAMRNRGEGSMGNRNTSPTRATSGSPNASASSFDGNGAGSGVGVRNTDPGSNGRLDSGSGSGSGDGDHHHAATSSSSPSTIKRNPSPKPLLEGEELELNLKILLIGPRHVGKTSLTNRITKNRFEVNMAATIGVEYTHHSWVYNKHPCGHPVKIKAQFWDIQGQDYTPVMNRNLASGTNAVMAVTSHSVKGENLTELARWINAFQKFLSNKIPVHVLVNKCDLVATKDRQDRMMNDFVSGRSWLADGADVGCSYDASHIRGFSHVSAKEATNLPKAVHDFVESVASDVSEEDLRPPEQPPEFRFTQQQKKKQKKKCGCA